MSRLAAFLLVSLCFTSLITAGDFESSKTENWHHWRGPLATGSAPRANPPLTWSDKQNIQWKVEIPGRGSATPIVWEDRVFVLTAIRTDRIDPNLPKPEDQPKRPFGITFPNQYYDFVVLCLDRATGETLWSKVATRQIPHRGHHDDNNFASASPTTDGQRLYAWFGSRGFYCYDLDGTLLWQRDLGRVSMRRSFGEGSSPVIHGDTLIVVRDQEEQSYIAALDANTGEPKWKVERDEQSTWATPLVVERDGRTQVITNATNRVRSYDLSNGKLIWECGGQVGNVTPSPVAAGELVVCMSGYRGNAAYAIPLDSQGDVTEGNHTVWSLDRGTPYVPSPLLHEGLLYFNQSNNAILSCIEFASGKSVIDRTRMPGLRRIYASPVAAAGRVYYVARDGTTLVIRHGTQFEVLATNKLSDPIDASPAVVGDQLFLRGQKHLYCISATGG